MALESDFLEDLNINGDASSCIPLFFNREISWLRFNSRVLDMAKNHSYPLLERLKFLAIYANNLDEFYMIRVSGLKRLYAQGMVEISPDRVSVKDQLEKIKNYVRVEQEEVENLYFELIHNLRIKGLSLLTFSELNSLQREKSRRYFHDFIYPVIVPIVLDSTHPFPHLSNLSFSLFLSLKKDSQTHYALIKIPPVLKRFIEIEPGVFVNIESIIEAFAKDLFKGFEVNCSVAFRLTRNADIEVVQEEADDFLQVMVEGLKARKNGQIVRVEFGSRERGLTKIAIENFLIHLPCEDNFCTEQGIDFYFCECILALSALWEIVLYKPFAHLLFPPFKPKNYYKNCDLYTEIKKKDILLFLPYESFESVVEFIIQAANDPCVVSIRMTLYRVGRDSPIVQALIEAAKTKQVTVLVELKARFDEENNMHWARVLEDAGAHVIYGLAHFKVHAKSALIIRQEGEVLRSYVHISTGNYNTSTAKGYTDISFFSSNQELCEDMLSFFHSLCVGSVYENTLKRLFLSPMQIKPKILDLISKEKECGKNGHIILKANALVDHSVIEALYEASCHGVRIDLIIRGICTLVPGLSGVSENIRVFSLVGKYLEHARIYFFKHSQNIYFSSADLMPRNLVRRVEFMCGLPRDGIGKKLFNILEVQLKDSSLYELQSDGSYKQVEKDFFNTHSFFERSQSKEYAL